MFGIIFCAIFHCLGHTDEKADAKRIHFISTLRKHLKTYLLTSKLNFSL